MTVRGFKDRQAELETYSGTASRQDQRLIDSFSVMEEDCVEFSLDVGKAFAKGMTFAELAALTGLPLRAVEFQLSGEDLGILKTIPGFEDYDPTREVLEMTKPIYGLKDAPRAWRIKLDRVLRAWHYPNSTGLRPLKAAPEIYVAHVENKHDRQQQKQPPNAMEKAILNTATPGEPLSERAALTKAAQEEIWRMTKLRELLIVVSTHVDDMKGTSKKAVAMNLLDHLLNTVGDCKIDFNNFAHTGVQHEHTPGVHYSHQRPYISQLRPIDPQKMKGQEDEAKADPSLHADYMSLLGSGLDSSDKGRSMRLHTVAATQKPQPNNCRV